jgi:hypothetical protein
MKFISTAIEPDSVRANARSEHRAGRATPQAASRLGHTATIGFRGATVWPLFTHRTLRPPQARGHRAFILAKEVWR